MPSRSHQGEGDSVGRIVRGVRCDLASAPPQGIKWAGMDRHPFSEGVWSEVLSPGGLQAQAHFAARWTACNLGRLSSRAPFSLWNWTSHCGILTSTGCGSI